MAVLEVQSPKSALKDAPSPAPTLAVRRIADRRNTCLRAGSSGSSVPPSSTHRRSTSSWTGAGRRHSADSGSSQDPAAIIRSADDLAHLLFPPSSDAFADAFLRGGLDVEGDMATAILAGSSIDVRRLKPADARRLLRWGVALRRGASPPPPLRRVARMRGKRHSPARDMAAIRFRYDVGEAFYTLWLDRRLTYSCAYFPDGTTATDAAARLDEAQEAKLDLIARKLGARAGVRMLDIGSGWRSLVGFVAERYGVETVGVTLSHARPTRPTRGWGMRGWATSRDRRSATTAIWRHWGPSTASPRSACSSMWAGRTCPSTSGPPARRSAREACSSITGSRHRGRSALACAGRPGQPEPFRRPLRVSRW